MASKPCKSCEAIEEHRKLIAQSALASFKEGYALKAEIDKLKQKIEDLESLLDEANRD